MLYANEGSQKNTIKNWHEHSYTDVETKARLIMQCLGQFKETTNGSVKSSVCPPEGKILHNCLRKRQFGCEISKKTRILQSRIPNGHGLPYTETRADEKKKKNRAATRLTMAW